MSILSAMDAKITFTKKAIALFVVVPALLIGGCVNSDNGILTNSQSTNGKADIVEAGADNVADVANIKSTELANDTDDQIIDEAETALPEPEADIEYGHFSEDVLSRVIIAEMAGQRGINDQALAEYLTLARETADINIIKRASRIATFSRDMSASVEMANLWLEQDPDSEEAHQTLVIQLISQSKYSEALEHMDRLIALGNSVDFRLISSRVATDESAVFIIETLIEEFQNLHERYPEDLSLFLSLAHLFQQNNQTQDALDAITDLATKMDNAPEVVILEVQLLEQLGKYDLARERLEQSLESNGQHKQLRLLYGRRLVDERRFAEAQEQFSIIVEQYPNDSDMIYSLALISMEVNRLGDAQHSFERLLELGAHLQDAHFYLAYISEQQNNPAKAIEHYLQVTSGSNFLPTQRNLTVLMIQAGRYAEASSRLQTIRFRNSDFNISLLTMEANALIDENMQVEAESLLNNAVAAYPDTIQLLYLRSVLSQEMNNPLLMEEDLRKVIQLDPSNPVAYNTLGYYLTESTNRYQEAYDLILHAVQLSPDDPAIIDSLGWAQYHLGLYDQAKSNLERAFELYPDHEVAAHLGEVLWVLGNTREANQVWQEALEIQPDSVFILNAMERLTSQPDS